MERPVKGDIVVVPFPFSDLSKAKKRPALVIAKLMGDDIILCQITTPARSDSYSISLSRPDFVAGGLNHDSCIRPNRLFTADATIVEYCAGKLSSIKLAEVVNKIIQILRA